MDTNTFLRRAVSDEGLYCMFISRISDQRRVQKFYDSLDELAADAKQFDDDGFDVYFALASFAESGSRKVDNAKLLKAFFLDLDCGPSKDFVDQRAALDALRTFCSITKLPKPYIVNSGRGVHTYWFLQEAVSKDDWVPVAEQLKKLCKEHGFLADPAVTADAARVLRVVGTHNHKSSPPSPVLGIGVNPPPAVDFDKFATLLGIDEIPVPKKYTPAPASAMMRALMGNTNTSFKEILTKTGRGRGCEQIKLIYTDRDNCSEPLWRAGLSIAKFCTDADKAIHKLSNGHEGYSAEATTEKAALIKGPYLCDKFDEFNPDVCKNCMHWGKIKSPITLGNTIIEATAEDNVVESHSATLANAPVQSYTVPTYPSPYFRGTNGGVYVRSSNADGDIDEKIIYHNDLYVVKRVRDAEIGEAIVMRLHLPKDGVSEFTVPLTAVTSREEFRKHMSMRGVAVSKMDEIMQYTTTWVNELQATVVADEAHRQFGWTNDKMESFIVGNQEVFGDRISFNPPASTTVAMFPAFDPKGTLDAWVEMADFLNVEGQEAYQYIMGASFGSVLMELMPVACSAFHIHSKDSGLGKTTALEAALTPWGDPSELLLGKEDTYNTKMNRGEVYHSIPLFLDELTNLSPKELSNLAYQYVSGRQRRRLTGSANVERYNGSAWSFTSVSTGNVSLIEKIGLYKQAPKAEAQRILEYKVDRLFKTAGSKASTDEWAQDVKKNWGHAGIPFVQYVINNLDEVKKLLSAVQKRIDKRAVLTSENRFWSAGAACSITALILCRRIGLLSYDPNKVCAWIVTVLKRNKNAVTDMNESVEQILNDYMAEHWNNVLWIKSTDDRRKQNGNGIDSLVIPDAVPKGKFVARYETDVKKAYLLPKPLKEWCGKQQINFTSFYDDLNKKLGAKKSKIRLSKGTHMDLPPTDVIVVGFTVEEVQEGAESGMEDVGDE